MPRCRAFGAYRCSMVKVTTLFGVVATNVGRGDELADAAWLILQRMALSKSDKKVAKHGKKIATSAPERRHEMRKALKNLRYTAEFFANLYDTAQSRRRSSKSLKRLQDIFGYVNDVAMAKELRDICDALLPPTINWHSGPPVSAGLARSECAGHSMGRRPTAWRHAKKRALVLGIGWLSTAGIWRACP